MYLEEYLALKGHYGSGKKGRILQQRDLLKHCFASKSMVNSDKWYIKMYTAVSAPKTFTPHRYTNKANNVRRNFRAKPIIRNRNNSINNVSAHTTITNIYILQLSEGDIFAYAD